MGIYTCAGYRIEYCYLLSAPHQTIRRAYGTWEGRKGERGDRVVMNVFPRRERMRTSSAENANLTIKTILHGIETIMICIW